MVWRWRLKVWGILYGISAGKVVSHNKLSFQSIGVGFNSIWVEMGQVSAINVYTSLAVEPLEQGCVFRQGDVGFYGYKIKTSSLKRRRF